MKLFIYEYKRTWNKNLNYFIYLFHKLDRFSNSPTLGINFNENITWTLYPPPTYSQIME